MNLESEGRTNGHGGIDGHAQTKNAKKGRQNLLLLIVSDFLRTQKLSLLLLVFVIFSAKEVLITTQQVRKQLVEREQLLLEHGILEGEWRNLVIEENVLADPKRVEYRAKKYLGMKYVTPDDETVIVIKSRQ